MLLFLLSILLCITKTFCISFNCPPCPPVSLEPYVGPLSLPCRQTYAGKCGCLRYCKTGRGDRCGGVLNYWGTCRDGLQCVYRPGGIINQEKHGFCETDYCSIQTCGYRQRCVDHMRRQIPTSLCKCHPLLNACNNDSTSNNTDTILCGDNGVTYTRHCNLRKAECKSGTLISIKHSGSCDYEENDAGGENLEGYVALHNVSLSYKPNYCLYQQRIYRVGDIISSIDQDPCVVMKCVEEGSVLSFLMPGCGEGYTFDLL